MIDAFEAGYKSAFEDVTDFIHHRIDNYIDYSMGFPYLDDEKLYEDLCSELLGINSELK